MSLISTKGRYATRVLVFLAMHEGDKPLRKQTVADAEGLTPAYVEQILIKLKVAGLVQSHRGREGGFSLGEDPARITVWRVLCAVEGSLSVVPCVGRGAAECPRRVHCSTRGIWERAERALRDVFEGETIASLAAAHRERRARDADFAI